MQCPGLNWACFLQAVTFPGLLVSVNLSFVIVVGIAVWWQRCWGSVLTLSPQFSFRKRQKCSGQVPTRCAGQGILWGLHMLYCRGHNSSAGEQESQGSGGLLAVDYSSPFHAHSHFPRFTGGKGSGIFESPVPQQPPQRLNPPGGKTSNIFGSPMTIAAPMAHPNKPKVRLAQQAAFLMGQNSCAVHLIWD